PALSRSSPPPVGPAGHSSAPLPASAQQGFRKVYVAVGNQRNDSIAHLHLQVRLGNDDAAIADNSPYFHALRQSELVDRPAQQARVLGDLRLHHLAEILPERIERRDRTTADMSQHR